MLAGFTVLPEIPQQLCECIFGKESLLALLSFEPPSKVFQESGDSPVWFWAKTRIAPV